MHRLSIVATIADRRIKYQIHQRLDVIESDKMHVELSVCFSFNLHYQLIAVPNSSLIPLWDKIIRSAMAYRRHDFH